ncbi:hypothetical protein AcW1_000217 [Taiwanofungus camphoratus]|nr:hypothetical protein AcV5_004115 [Antrodia cinnamomea]KAI0963008.1 hypothetical protein AcW1_000217 [Antrodia cinnamomea]
MAQMHTLEISPPLLNSSCLWASDLDQLRELYGSPYTGAVTTRTATLRGYKEDTSNAVVFARDTLATLNSYGYSPHPLSQYLEWVGMLLTAPSSKKAVTMRRKPIILSITASNPADLSEMLKHIVAFRARLHSELSSSESDAATLVALELNTSCPNIPSAPPPSYHLPALRPLLDVLAEEARSDPGLTLGLKLPPYPDVTRVTEVVACLSEYTFVNQAGEKQNPFAFLTCTNTLGGSLLFTQQAFASLSTSTPTSSPTATDTIFALPPALGGLGGAPLHPLALGTVLSFSRALAMHSDPAVRAIKLIGVGGVVDCAAAARMRAAGACAVGCATLLGKEGVRAFEILSKERSEEA